MFLTSFAAGPWQTNCYLVAPRRGADPVVVDPGVGALEPLTRVLTDEGVGVAGVLLTHGHIDHVASAAEVADRWNVPAWIHPLDRELLSPFGPVLAGALQLARELGADLREPRDLRAVTDGQDVVVGGLTLHVHHAPGHRPGCVMYSLASDEPSGARLLFTGDVLFAGSVGRTDLPGGDPAAMARTLRDVVLPLPDDWIVLPGHGPRSTVGVERAANPYLNERFLRTL